MLFCFGLFAECSYTYRAKSQQPIEVQSADYERQGFQRCEFFIQLASQHQHLKLNFTRLTGFGFHTAFTRHGQHEGPGEEKEEEKEEGRGSVGGAGLGGSDGGGEGVGTGGGGARGKSLDRTFNQSQGPRNFTTTTESTVARDWGSKPVSPSSPATVQEGKYEPAAKQVYANTKLFSKTMASDSSSQSLPPPPSSPSLQPSLSSPSPSSSSPSSRDVEGRPPCLPMLEIRAINGDGEEKMLQRICRKNMPSPTPIVFHYASSVRIVYEWQQEHHSGFTLYFDYSNTEREKCVHTCDGSRCLTDGRQLCDGHPDCSDQSDEGHPACVRSGSPSSSSSSSSSPSTSSSDALDAENLVQLIVIPSCAVLTVLVLAVLCLLGRRQWQGAHSAMLRGNSHGTHLSCPQSHSSEGLAPSACSAQECNEQVVALLPSSHRCHKSSWRPSHPSSHHPHPKPTPAPQIGLPPNIPVSPDGEEGYVASQIGLLHPRYHITHSELFKPPPNKTVFDRESPPPYSVSSCSTRSSACGSAPSPSSAGWLGQQGAGQVRVVRDSAGQTVVSRCYTMFSPCDRPHPHHHQHHHHHSRSEPPPRSSPSPSPINNSLAKHDQQRPSPCVHGASRVKDALLPSPAPHPVMADTLQKSSPVRKGLISSSSSPVHLVSQSGNTSVVTCPQTVGSHPPLLCVSTAGQEVDGVQGKESDHPEGNNCVELGAPPPPYQLAMGVSRVGREGDVEGSPRCTSHTTVSTAITTPLPNTISSSSASTPTTTTTTTTSNPAGV